MTAGTVFIRVTLAGPPWARAVMNFLRPDGAFGAEADEADEAAVVLAGSAIGESAGSALMCFLGALSSSSLLVGGGGSRLRPPLVARGAGGSRSVRVVVGPGAGRSSASSSELVPVAACAYVGEAGGGEKSSGAVCNLVPRAFPLKVGWTGKDPGIGWSRDPKHPKILGVINYDVTNV